MYCLYSTIRMRNLMIQLCNIYVCTCIIILMQVCIGMCMCISMFISLVINSSSPNTADVTHVTISVTMFPMSSLLLVGTALYLVMFSVTAFSGSDWFRGRDRVTEPLVWLMARNWTVSVVKSATCTPSTSTVNRSVG